LSAGKVLEFLQHGNSDQIFIEKRVEIPEANEDKRIYFWGCPTAATPLNGRPGTTVNGCAPFLNVFFLCVLLHRDAFIYLLLVIFFVIFTESCFFSIFALNFI